ncbi:MAG: DUF11 domain-containing protein, partial [Clostridiales Family XIII bacterium]|nr:DUF11 domain-containing protein [Clostridiales Family XIII bacterium]
MNQIRINRKRSTIFIIAILVTVISRTATGSIAQQRATPLDQLMAEKTARVNNGYVDNGTATYPVPVKLQDEIEYEIKVKLPTASVAAQYDFLFLIDWSPSMDSGYNPGEDGSTTGNHAYGARNKATILARTISKDLFDLYPGSRAAMLAMNSNIHNQGNTGYSTTQVDTDFMTDPNRLPLGTTVGVSKLFFDDTAIFMRAATDKFRGNAREYGGLASLHSGGKVAPKVNINPRRDRNRTPVLVFLSDFQLGMNEPETKGSWDLYNQYVKDFIKYCPGGILVSARADTRESRFNGNNGTYGKYYATPKHDAAMDSTVELGGKRADGSDRWGWVKFTEGQSQEDQNKLVLDMLKDKLAVPPPSGDIIDLLPEGLEYISSSPAGTKTTVNGRDRVIWDYAIFPPGETAVTVKAKVKDYGIFINTGDVVVQGYNPVTTNQTYHEA